MTDTVGSPASEPKHGRRIFLNTAVNGLTSLLKVAVAIVLLPIIIGHLGLPAYGIWVLAGSFSLSGGLLSLADVGLHKSLAKFIAGAEARRRLNEISTLASSALAAFAVLSVAAGASVAALSATAPQLFSVPPELASALQVLILLFALEATVGLPSLVFMGLLEGLQRFGAIRAIEIVQVGLYVMLVAVVIRGGWGVVAFGAASVIGGLLAAVAAVIVGRRALPGLQLRMRLVSARALRELMGFSGWLFASKINGVVWRQMDKVILATVLSTSVLAGYDVALKIQAAALLVLSFTASALVPAASHLAELGDRDALRQLFLRGTRYTMALSIPVVLAAIVMAPALIEHWVGPRFADMVPAARLFLSYQLFVSAASVGLTMLVGIGRVRTTTIYAGVATVLNLALSLWLVRPFGVLGVVAATVASFAVTTPLYIRLALKETGETARCFLRETVGRLLPWAVLFLAVLELSRRLFPPQNLLSVAIVCVPAFTLYVLGVARYATPSHERRAILGYMALRGRG